MKVDQINAALESGMVIDASSEEVKKKEAKKVPTVGEALTKVAKLKAAAGKKRTQQAYDSFMRVFAVWAKLFSLMGVSSYVFPLCVLTTLPLLREPLRPFFSLCVPIRRG